jgi:L-ornithine N5-oxygenase
MIYDVLGIGFGPSNIALAIAMEEKGYGGSVLFLERKENSQWHPDMLLSGSDIQNNPLRDLITPVNPRSHYTFVNFLHQSGRFFEHLNLGRLHPLRRDYFDYVTWAAAQFGNVQYGVDVVSVTPDSVDGRLVWRVRTATDEYLAYHLVLGIGRNLNIPSQFELGPAVAHCTDYLTAIKGCPKDTPIAVVGASQSAVEIMLDLLDRSYCDIHAIHRSFSFRLKDTSPFSDEVYFPEFVDYYHRLPPKRRAKLDQQIRATNYSSVDGDVLDALYQRQYELRLDGRNPLALHRCTEVDSAEVRPDGVRLSLRETNTEELSQLEVGLVILATGFLDVGRNGQDGLPNLLKAHWQYFSWDEEYLRVGRDYRVLEPGDEPQLPPLYMNGLCESSHGLGDAGSFSLVSVRAQTILESLQGGVK